MPWDEETQEYYPGPKDRKPTVKCVMCGRTFDADDRGNYVEIGDSPVCSGVGSSYDSKCKWEFIDEEFTEYIRTHDVLNRLNAIIANPTLDAIIALRKELADWGMDETGSTDTTNTVNSVLGPLYDAEDVLKRGLTEYLPETLEEAKKAIETVAPPVIKSK
jgi:hypothetical protein